MSDFYQGLIDDTVVPLISRFGQTIVRTRTTEPTGWVKEYDASEGRYRWRHTSSGAIQYTEPTGATSTTTGQGVITTFQDDQIDDTLVKRGDRLLLTQNIGEPQLNDTFLISGVTYRYINHQTVSPGGLDVLYRIQLRV